MKQIDVEKIDYHVVELMHRYGPDGHVDGHDVIAQYIVHLLKWGCPEAAFNKAKSFAETE